MRITVKLQLTVTKDPVAQGTFKKSKVTSTVCFASAYMYTPHVFPSSTDGSTEYFPSSDTTYIQSKTYKQLQSWIRSFCESNFCNNNW